MNFFSNAGPLSALAQQCSAEYGPDAPPPVGFPTEAELLFGTWEEEGYERGIYLLWRRGGNIYEMKLSHCSCNSYSDNAADWARAEPISVEYLRRRERPFYDDSPDRLVAWDAALETAC